MQLIFLLLLTLNLHAERIIALSPSIAEILFALNRGDEVVGVSDYTVFPEKAASLPKVGGYFQPNVEKILSLRPTLVIAQPHHAQLLKQLHQLGLKTEQVRLENIEQIKTSIAQLGSSHTSEAKKLIYEIDHAIKQGYSPKNNITVMIVFGLFADLRENIYISGKKLFFNEIIEICGAENVFKSEYPKQPVLNYESLIALNPDKIIILNSNQNIDKDHALKNWYALPIKAAKNGNIYVIEHDFISIPSHRVALSIDAICKAIHD